MSRRCGAQSVGPDCRRDDPADGEKEPAESERSVSVGPFGGLHHRYGHGKVEALGAMGIACFLIGTSLMIGWDSYQSLQDILVNHTVNDYNASGSLLTYWVRIDDAHDR